jgi:hypothetical protein
MVEREDVMRSVLLLHLSGWVKTGSPMCTIILHSMVQEYLSTVRSGMLWPEGCIEEAL